MGLGVSAFSKLRKLDALFDADGEPVDPTTRERICNAVSVYVNCDFPGRADELEDRGVYAFEGSTRFHAGSYGGYNAWREQLAKLAGYPKQDVDPAHRYREHSAAAWLGLAEGLPFVELVNFSDCEGVIGAGVAAKLARDFADFDERAAGVGDYFYEKYREWRQAFELAADGGCVRFH